VDGGRGAGSGLTREADRSGSPGLAVASAGVLGIVVAAAVATGVYWLVNPNHIDFAAPVPLVAELASLVAAAVLGAGAATQRARARPALFLVGLLLAVIAVVLLGIVAVTLSYTEL
jgi:hypothetical protein